MSWFKTPSSVNNNKKRQFYLQVSTLNRKHQILKNCLHLVLLVAGLAISNITTVSSSQVKPLVRWESHKRTSTSDNNVNWRRLYIGSKTIILIKKKKTSIINLEGPTIQRQKQPPPPKRKEKMPKDLRLAKDQKPIPKQGHYTGVTNFCLIWDNPPPTISQ